MYKKAWQESEARERAEHSKIKAEAELLKAEESSARERVKHCTELAEASEIERKVLAAELSELKTRYQKFELATAKQMGKLSKAETRIEELVKKVAELQDEADREAMMREQEQIRGEKLQADYFALTEELSNVREEAERERQEEAAYTKQHIADIVQEAKQEMARRKHEELVSRQKLVDWFVEQSAHMLVRQQNEHKKQLLAVRQEEPLQVVPTGISKFSVSFFGMLMKKNFIDEYYGKVLFVVLVKECLQITQ